MNDPNWADIMSAFGTLAIATSSIAVEKYSAKSKGGRMRQRRSRIVGSCRPLRNPQEH